MKSQYLVRFVLSMLVLFALVSIAFAGGWATITLNDFPDYAVAGQALNLTFTIRQHGQTPLGGLQPGVRATTGNGRIATAVVKPGASRGEYAAALTLPEPGEWTIVIDSGFNASATTLPNLKVIAAGTPAPTSFSPATRDCGCLLQKVASVVTVISRSIRSTRPIRSSILQGGGSNKTTSRNF